MKVKGIMMKRTILRILCRLVTVYCVVYPPLCGEEPTQWQTHPHKPLEWRWHP